MTKNLQQQRCQKSAIHLKSFSAALGKIKTSFAFALICTKIEMFRPTLEAELLNHDKKSNAGAKPIDVVLMFKVILIKRFYNLSDEQAEYQIIDRQSFKEFLGLSSGDKIPDARFIWLFKDNLSNKNVTEQIFEQQTIKLKLYLLRCPRFLLKSSKKRKIIPLLFVKSAFYLRYLRTNTCKKTLKTAPYLIFLQTLTFAIS